VHLACHAAVREPVAESALFLASGPHDDGRLLPDEIAGVRMPGALIFLSACQTGLGRPTSDGVLGLSRAFIEAGARCVVMSMWKVADEAAARLAHHFYAELLRKQGIATAAQALRAAMRATRKDLASGSVVTSRHEVLDDHPAHWAPFLLLGDGTMTWNE
jgi:CHAT domain-containing protein